MADPDAPKPDDSPDKPPTPMADWMAVWADEEARDRAGQAKPSDLDTQVLLPEQVLGAGTPAPAPPPDPPPPAGDPSAPTTSFDAAFPPQADFDTSLDGEIRQLLERTAKLVKRQDVSEPGTVMQPPPGARKTPLDFETPPGAWSAMTPAPAAFDEVESYRDETGGRLGLFEPTNRDWEDPPTPHGPAGRKRPSAPPAPAFESPSMTAPLPEPSSAKKPSGPPKAGTEARVAPIPWTDAPPPEQAAAERSPTRRMKDTARRVRKSLEPIAAAAVAEPAAPWLSLGTIGVAAAWIATGAAAGRGAFVAVGLAFLVPVAILAAVSAMRRG